MDELSRLPGITEPGIGKLPDGRARSSQPGWAAMNSEVNRSGSLKLNAAAEQATINGTWTGECPAGGERVEFGSTGWVSVHEPPRTGGRPDERLHHGQARATNQGIDRGLFTQTIGLGYGARLAVPANLDAASAAAHPP